MDKKKENVLLWGAGNTAKEIMQNACFSQDYISIVGITDSSPDKWGETINGMEIKPFKELMHMSFDKVVIASNIYFDEIRKKLIEEFNVDDNVIENQFYFAKVKMLQKYCNSGDRDIQDIVKRLQKYRLDVFNYEFAEKYVDLDAEVHFDKDAGMFYVIHLGRKMYMAKSLNTEQKVLKYYQSICVEQDVQSPHLYVDQQFAIQTGDVVVDVGVAEGNFSLQIIDKASKIFMIEADEGWVEALEYTFAPYKNKVIILNKFISNYVLGNIDTLDNLIKDKVNFIKMDIEGFEGEALLGAERLIRESERMRCAICAYHRDNDDIFIDETAQHMGLSAVPVKGYMYYYNDVKQRYISPMLRRGVLRYEKGN